MSFTTYTLGLDERVGTLTMGPSGVDGVSSKLSPLTIGYESTATDAIKLMLGSKSKGN